MFSTNKKILSQGIFMWNMNNLALSVDKLKAILDFSKKEFETPRLKLLLPTERSCHKEYQSFSTHG